MKKRKPPTRALLSAYFAEMGRRGGQKSRRTLTAEQARAMVEAREKKRAEKRRGA